MFTKTSLSSLMVAIGTGLFLISSIAAQQALDVHDVYPTSRVRSDRCAKFWLELEPLLRTIESANKSKNYNAIKVASLGRAYAQASAIFRDGDALKNTGETAGVDWSLRGEVARGIISGLVTNMLETKAGSDLAKKASQYRARTDKKRAAEVAKIEKLLSQKKYDEAELAISQLMFDIDTFYLWISQQEQQAVAGQTRKILDEMSRVHAEIRPVRRKQLGLDRIKQLGINFNQLFRDADAASLEIKAEGKTTIDGKSLNGAEAFNALAKRWLELRRKFLNAAGFSVMFDNVWDTTIGDIFGADPLMNDWKPADMETNKRMTAALLKLIEADTAKANPADIPSLYQQYVSAICDLAIELHDSKFETQCQAALVELAKRDSGFGAKVDNYLLATNDLLHWRNRLAVSQATARSKESSALLTDVDTQLLLPQLRAGVPEGLAALQPKVGTETSFGYVYLHNGNHFSVLNERVFHSLSREVKVEPDAKLIADLYAEGDSVLSLPAAIAIKTAKSGHYEQAGGKIVGIKPHAMPVYFINLKDDANRFCPPTRLSGQPPGLTSVLLEAQVEPNWIQHRYFFVDLTK